jgi:polynucleotide 5'-hydroxyl-kinase GRC3/NOL9
MIIPDPGWENLVERLRSLRGAALFLGRSDSGKSTLVRYLAGRLLESGVTVALVDADVGQSFLGLPGTVSRRSFTAPLEEPARFTWQHLSFLGSVTPVPILSLLAAETGRMVLASRQEAQVTLIDTTGLVRGPLGLALKLAKIRATAPELVVAISAGAELDRIVAAMPESATLRLRPSVMVQRRTPTTRIRYRYGRLAAHLRGAREALVSTRRLLFMHRGAPVHPLFTYPEPGTVVGLNHQGETRALGVVTEADAGSITLLTPLRSLRGVDRVIVGDFSYRPQRH